MQIFRVKQNTTSTTKKKKAAASVYTVNTQIFVPAEISEEQILEKTFDNLARSYYS